ncbi:Xaa-Pro dipeptidase [Caloranaerobacter azorensis H53214]|uniref:Xaa-Pro dipeptidase n=1 Tax=Caloranaerobacter azorensis H53214 TaxID=1156417 RepID=A0A096BKR6_9FIRM|nr:Xaa-Pro peptidase family protein [Caloranaerobacter azorensis]KGG81437.1 Xaa-Pro dipeptidase [Caloranaerobacter azorensis H53214]
MVNSVRIEQLKKYMKEADLDSVIIFKPENRRYISGFTGTSGYVIITDEEYYMATDFRYLEQVSVQCKGFKIIELNSVHTIFDVLNELKIKRLGIEDNFTTLQFVKNLEEKCSHIDIVPLKGVLEKIRMIKDKEEIELIRRAAEITDKAFNHILDFIKVGVKEVDIALELEYFMKKLGAEGPSFKFIIASGKRSAMPHGVASDKVVEEGDFVTIDMGCIYKGYCSDMTRTIVVGKANEEQKKIYNIVLEAQEKSLKAIRPDIKGCEVDKIARDIIAGYGYGEYFGHGLGHGVGLEIHENPRLAQSEMGKIALKPGMIVTDEPGIYIPNFGGVRIEDLILVTEDGYEVLSKTTKELIEIS